ncbi:AvrD family protein [Rhodococcus sp. 1168]|uniref:AvrD family protein n=1 Tax=Rhodococcus sp. 1168 TaxID=2018041 RepID=UPI000A0B9E41|nr:AvrD family protein [Rhodococcus sp. 1168]ORI17280.1 hypothetical protein BJI47_13635 [Rhodococcus sp. 1168]
MCTHTLEPTIEDLLGPADTRFFGDGFRKVDYTRGPLSIRHDANDDEHRTTVDSVVGVQYPGDWSVKKPASGLRPHFSTLDGLILGAELAEASLACAEEPSELTRARIRKIQISAGSAPQENLDNIPASAIRRTALVPRAGGSTTSSRVDCRLGGMRVRFDIDHKPTAPPKGSATHEHPEQVLGSARARYYGDGFKTRSHKIVDVAIDDDGRQAVATLFVDDNGHALTAGIGGSNGTELTPVDVFVTALQTAQVLLYDLDEMRRADSNTLWMRRTTITAADSPERTDTGVAVSTRLDNCELLTKNEKLWRTADIVAVAAGIELTCSVAHQLPDHVGGHR